MYTHTFEIVIDGINVEGEISFNANEPPKVKFNNPPEMSLHELHHTVEMLEGFNRTCASCGTIHKIELIKK